MSLISKIRERSGLAVSMVALSMILFIVGGDLLSGNSRLLSLFGKSDDIGEINGHTITATEFQGEMNRIENEFRINQNKEPNEQERQSIKEQAWNELITKYAFKQQWDELGIKVTEKEQIDMVQGENLHPSVKQAFTDPQTGQFNSKQLKEFLSNIPVAAQKSEDAYRQYIAWSVFESKLPDDRRRTKYENMLGKTNYITTLEAKREYENQTAKAQVKYCFIPYTTISDSSVKPTDEQLQEYLTANKEKYKGQDNVNLDYIQFKITPSSADSASSREELVRIKGEFATTTEDSAFAAANSDAPATPKSMSPGDLPKDLASIAGSLKAGEVVGPFVQGANYTLYKIKSIANEGEPAARASHILIRWNSPSPEDKKKAMDTAMLVLNRIKKGEVFEAMAMKYGTDGAASQGGDVGWFKSGAMVAKFQDAVFNNPKGLIGAPVETEFGYHIIKVTEPRTTLKYNVITVEKAIKPSPKTENMVYNEAARKVGGLKTKEDFEALLKKETALSRLSAPNVPKNSNYLNDATDAREIIRWAYNDAKEGDVSRIFTLKDRLVVATLVRRTEEGKPTLEGLRDIIKPEVIKNLKAKQILAKIEGAKSLDEMAKKYGNGAVVNTAPEVTPSTSALPDLGYDPVALGVAFGLKENATSKPRQGESGVYALQMVKLTKATEIADYTSYKQQAEQRKMMPAQYMIMEAVKQLANIKDNRIKAY